MNRVLFHLLLAVACNLACTRSKSPSSESGPAPLLEGAPAPADGAEDPLVARYRADVLRIEPSTSPTNLEHEVAKFASALEEAKTRPFPASQVECVAMTKTWADRDCTLVVGDVVKPKWFEACKAKGGAVTKSSAPPDTPTFYDRELCSRTFRVGE